MRIASTCTGHGQGHGQSQGLSHGQAMPGMPCPALPCYALRQKQLHTCTEVTHALLYCTCQSLEHHCTQLAHCDKRPYCVGEPLAVAIAQVPLCCLHKYLEQWHICLTSDHTSLRNIGGVLYVEIAHTPLCCPRQRFMHSHVCLTCGHNKTVNV